MPWPCTAKDDETNAPPVLDPAIDPDRTVKHGLGFVPMVWIKNLPGGDAIDGAPTFRTETINTVIEIDYLLSQGGRGLRYASDPTLLIKEPAAGADGEIVKGAANAIVVDKDGDAKLLEINGTASQALIDWFKMLRELALESMHGNRVSPEKLSAAQSGRAMEMMNQALVWLADRLRISYGEGGLLSLLRMIVRASATRELTIAGDTYKDLDAGKPISLIWPAWFPPTAQDRNHIAATLKTHTDAGHMSRETAMKTIAPIYDVEDTGVEIARITEQEKARYPAAPETSDEGEEYSR
jgi:hypothetical protein